MNSSQQFIDWLQERLQKELPGNKAHQKMIHRFRETPTPFPADSRQSAVLFGLYIAENDLKVIMIERSKRDGSPHSGQIALPGGRAEDEDASLWHTALRESEEEISLPPSAVQQIGKLSPIYIPVSNFVVHPYIGFITALPSLKPADAEVQSILHLSVDALIRNQISVNVNVPAAPGGIIETQAYGINNQQYVWGATAMLFAEFEAIYEEYKSIYPEAYSI